MSGKQGQSQGQGHGSESRREVVYEGTNRAGNDYKTYNDGAFAYDNRNGKFGWPRWPGGSLALRSRCGSTPLSLCFRSGPGRQPLLRHRKGSRLLRRPRQGTVVPREPEPRLPPLQELTPSPRLPFPVRNSDLLFTMSISISI